MDYVLDEARATSDPLAKVQILHKAVSSWSGALSNNVINGVLDLDNLELWLRQAKQDPEFQKANLTRWANTLETHIHRTTLRFECARLFGNIFQEWLSSGDSVVAGVVGQEKKEATGFIDIGRKEKHEHLERFTSLVFEEKPIDTDALRLYLSGTFSDKHAYEALENAQDDMKEFCDTFRSRTKITIDDVKSTIDSFIEMDH